MRGKAALCCSESLNSYPDYMFVIMSRLYSPRGEYSLKICIPGVSTRSHDRRIPFESMCPKNEAALITGPASERILPVINDRLIEEFVLYWFTLMAAEGRHVT